MRSGLETRDTEVARRRPTFPKDDGFLATLRSRTDAYLSETGRRPQAGLRMAVKAAIILTWLAASYYLLVFHAGPWTAGPLAVSLALAMAGVGFSIQHDGGHSAFSPRRWVNKLASMSLDLIGASSFLWHTKHAVIHHTYVNIQGQDTDIDVGALVRLGPEQPYRWFHRFQHVYLWGLYGLMASRWHLVADFQEMARGKIGPHKLPKASLLDWTLFFAGKASSIFFFLVLPMFYHPWWLVLIFYFAVTGLLGLVMSVVFQLAHCVEEAEFPLPNDEEKMENSWAIHQVETTVDFAQGSRVLTWFLGGLNFQIEHHLFPRVSHVHYPALSKIVRQTCEEYGLKYQVHETFVAGVASHYRWLKRMSVRPAQPGAAVTAA